MKTLKSPYFSLAVVGITSLLVSAPLGAKAQLAGTRVTGSIYFNGGFSSNGYDPVDGAVPAGFENTAGTTVTISNTAVEFGFADMYNADSADFTDLTLTVRDQVGGSGASPWVQTFTDPGFSGLVSKVSDTFGNGGVTASALGDTITLNWAGTNATGVTYAAVFNIGSTLQVPEPSTWALLGLGSVGMLGVILRRRVSV